MSISIEKLSLLDSLAPLRFKADNNVRSNEGEFVDKLDKALGVNNTVSESADKARDVAEALTLQMLHSSLALAGGSDEAAEYTASHAPLSSVDSFVKAYRDNLAKDAAPQMSSTPADLSKQDGEPSAYGAAAAPAMTEAVRIPPDASWLNPVIARASQKYGVDASLIRAVIKAESNFNPQAVSHAGARGLMQLMPATARSLGVNDSFDPEQNVMGGTRFLKDMLKRYDGDVDSALAAYNWGPGNVDRQPDRLPRETRDYLARVKHLYASYSG